MQEHFFTLNRNGKSTLNKLFIKLEIKIILNNKYCSFLKKILKN